MNAATIELAADHGETVETAIGADVPLAVQGLTVSYGDKPVVFSVDATFPAGSMQGVMEAAERQGFPEEVRHLEYFSVPDLPDYENFDFTVRLMASGREFHIPADRAATDVLQENGIAIDVKCSDGLCGVCKCGLISGEVEHRDFVLSKKQQDSEIILCQSRAAKPDGVIEIDL